MNLVLIAASSFMIALSGAMVPGPLFTITVSESIRRGASAGPRLILGHAILELLIIVMILSGLSPFLRHELSRQVIGLVGGCMLVLMGIVTLKNLSSISLDLSAKGDGKEMNLIVTGIIGSLANPYWVIWWATIGLGYLMSSMKYGFAGVAVFFLGHISADLLWYSIISYAAAKGRKVMGDKSYRAVLAVCALFLIAFGVWFIRSA